MRRVRKEALELRELLGYKAIKEALALKVLRVQVQLELLD